MYATLLPYHSLFRWLVLISLVFAVYKAYDGWRNKRTFSKLDNRVRHWTATIVHIQFTLGLILYFSSPLVDYFLNHFSEAVHLRSYRFFGMEHSLVMFLAVIVITIGSAKAKRKSSDQDKFKTMAIWFGIGLLLILSSIPWPFWPFESRPWIRAF